MTVTPTQEHHVFGAIPILGAGTAGRPDGIPPGVLSGSTHGSSQCESTVLPQRNEGEISTAQAMSRVKKLSGLRWDQLAEILGVTRRTLHNWVEGKPLSESNERLLRDLQYVLEKTDLGKPFLNRRGILTECDGVCGFDLLLGRRYDDFIGLFEDFHERGLPKGAVSEQIASTKPLPPAILANATYDSSMDDSPGE